MAGVHDAHPPAWDEDHSAVYRSIAPVAVPARVEQLAVVTALVPLAEHERGTIVDLACGEGLLSRTLLEAFPRASVVALDGSASMRERAQRLLRPFADRAGVSAFELASEEWPPLVGGADAVVSSLALHHLSGPARRG